MDIINTGGKDADTLTCTVVSMHFCVCLCSAAGSCEHRRPRDGSVSASA